MLLQIKPVRIKTINLKFKNVLFTKPQQKRLTITTTTNKSIINEKTKKLNNLLYLLYNIQPVFQQLYSQFEWDLRVSQNKSEGRANYLKLKYDR